MTPFQKQARDLVSWHKTAMSLRRSARLLQHAIEADLSRIAEARYESGTEVPADRYPGLQLSTGFCLVAAYALENLLKGVLISREPELVREQKLDSVLITHRLLHLAQRAGFTLEVLDAFFLEAASEYGTWAGKYHTSRSLQPGRVFTWAFSDADFATFDRLFGMFEPELRKHVKGSVVYRVIGAVPGGPKE